MDSFAGLQIGDLVALSTETPQDAPWIVQVTGMEGEISIEWMEGTTTAVLTPSSLALATSSYQECSCHLIYRESVSRCLVVTQGNW